MRAGPAGLEGRPASSYELLDHPAEVGLRAWGPTPSAAFAAAAEGLLWVVVDPATVRVAEWRDVGVEAADPGDLLVAWLNELLYLLDAEGFVPARCEVERWAPTSLAARVGGEPVDPRRHDFRTEVKTVTHHDVRVEERDGAWWVHAILDV